MSDRKALKAETGRENHQGRERDAQRGIIYLNNIYFKNANKETKFNKS